MAAMPPRRRALVLDCGSVTNPDCGHGNESVALAMGVPVEPLALLVAVEMLPDIMRTLANVTADVALAGATDRKGENLATDSAPARSEM